MDIKIEHDGGDKRGEFFAKQGEKPAGVLSYLWSDKTHLVVYFTEALNGFDEKEVETDLFDAVASFARDNSAKIIPVSSVAKSTFLNDEKKYADVLELDHAI